METKDSREHQMPERIPGDTAPLRVGELARRFLASDLSTLEDLERKFADTDLAIPLEIFQKAPRKQLFGETSPMDQMRDTQQTMRDFCEAAIKNDAGMVWMLWEEWLQPWGEISEEDESRITYRLEEREGEFFVIRDGERNLFLAAVKRDFIERVCQGPTVRHAAEWLLGLEEEESDMVTVRQLAIESGQNESTVRGRIHRARQMGRDARRRGLKKGPGRGHADKDTPCIIAWAARTGKAVLQVVQDFTSKTVEPAAKTALEKGSRVFTDSAKSYLVLSTLGFEHQSVNHSQGAWVRGEVHENRAEMIWSLLKFYLWTFRGVSKRLLGGYVGFFQFLFNHRALTAFQKAELLLSEALDPGQVQNAQQGLFAPVKPKTEAPQILLHAA